MDAIKEPSTSPFAGRSIHRTGAAGQYSLIDHRMWDLMNPQHHAEYMALVNRARQGEVKILKNERYAFQKTGSVIAEVEWGVIA